MGAWLEALRAEVTGVRWLPAWASLQVAAALAAFVWFWRRTRRPDPRLPESPARLRLCLLLAYIGAAAGAALLGILVRIPAFIRSGFVFAELFRGGILAYGALAGLVGTYAALARLRRLPVLVSLDILAPCLGALVLVARIGCFFGGCDFGSATSVPWGVRFPPGSPAFRRHLEGGLILPSDRASLAVHPAQLYEAALGIAMAAVALLIERRSAAANKTKPLPPGSAFAAAAITYAVGRFLIEFVRGDAPKGASGPLTPSQWLSALALAAAAAIAIIRSLPLRARGW
jgi:phosphatidylglycerol:prolipoprotein diacylglycerol transferase